MSEFRGGMFQPFEEYQGREVGTAIVKAAPREAALVGRPDHILGRAHEAETQLDRGEPHAFTSGGEVIFQMDRHYANALRHAAVEAYEDVGETVGFAVVKDVVEHRQHQDAPREAVPLDDTRL